MTVEATRAIGNADLGAEDERGAMNRHRAVEVEVGQQIRRMDLDDVPLPGVPAVSV